MLNKKVKNAIKILGYKIYKEINNYEYLIINTWGKIYYFILDNGHISNGDVSDVHSHIFELAKKYSKKYNLDVSNILTVIKDKDGEILVFIDCEKYRSYKEWKKSNFNGFFLDISVDLAEEYDW